MKPIGLLLVILAALFPLPLFIELMPKHDSGALLSQYLGSAALILMAISQLMSTRAPGIQAIFGGLDRVYLLHKWIGIITISAMMLHDVIDAEMDNLGRETWLSDMAEEGGEIALYGLLILGLISLITFVPYELWKRTHKFIGAFFALSAFHYFYMLKPFELTDPLGLYISGFCILGIVCYLYMLLLHGFIDRPHAYKVKMAIQHNDILEVTLSPLKRGFKHKAGQFAFLHLNGEKHPFTIASHPNGQREIKFCIKGLGDFTRKLPTHLSVGQRVWVSRPFGHFTLPKASKQCWIAGGIGVTPFIAWAKALKTDPDTSVHLYYCVRSDIDEIPFLDQLEHPNITLHLINSAKGQRLSIERLKEDLGFSLSDFEFSFCGPKRMREMLQKNLKLSYEEFEMRSGTSLAFLLPAIKWCIEQILTLKQNRQHS